MTQSDYIEAAERRRKQRERELLLLLLIALERAYAHSILAFRHGLDWKRIISNILQGNEAASLRGITASIAEQLALAHISGSRLAAYKVGTYYVPDKAELIRAYQATAESFVQATVDGVWRSFWRGIGGGDDVRDAIRKIREALKVDGWHRDNPYAIKQGDERIVVSAFNNGVFDFAFRGDGSIKGFEHESVMDSVTTERCRERDRLRLPIDHSYWLENWPSLHYNCRSMIVPLAYDFEPSDSLPMIPPMEGFGRIPAEILSLIQAQRVA